MKATLFVDGGSRQENKHTCVGVSLCDPAGKELLALSDYTGPGTSNQAEYGALLRGLVECQALGITDLTVFSDSKMMVDQLNGGMQVANPRLKKPHEQCRRLIRRFASFSITHVCREDNQRADFLVNRAFSDRRFLAEVTGDASP